MEQAFEINNIYLVLLFAFMVGLAVGSFVTMASHRLPLDEDIVVKPSYCPSCHTALKAIDLVPLFSWMSMRGLCRYCRAPVGIRYPLTELTLGLVFAGLVAWHGLSLDTLFYCLLATILAILIVTDLEHTIIPDSLQVALLITGILYRWHHGDPWLHIFMGGMAGLTFGLALRYGYLILRHIDALGWGDVKFLGAAGVWLTLSSAVPFLFIAGVAGTLTGLGWRFVRGPGIFPFGPALALSLFINVLWPDIMNRLLL